MTDNGADTRRERSKSGQWFYSSARPVGWLAPAIILSVIGMLITIGFLPKCSDYQTTAAANTEHRYIWTSIERNNKEIEKINVRIEANQREIIDMLKPKSKTR